MGLLPLAVRHGVDVNASPDEVYALLADVRRRPTWLEELHTTDAPDRPLEKGDRFEGRSAILLHDFAGQSEVTWAEPAVGLEERVILGASLSSRWTIDDRGSGASRVAHELIVELPGGPLGRIERFVLALRLRRMQRASLAALSAQLSAGG